MKKLMLFLMVCIPILIVLIVKLTAGVAVGQIYVAVESITIDPDSVVAKVGEKVNLGFSIYPENASNKDVIWNSDNESAAIVDSNGHVEFVGIGSGYITAITQDGNMRSQCYFYVYDTVVHKVELVSPQNYVHIGETMRLSAIILPDEAINKNVTFSSSNPEIATVDANGLVQGITEGYTTITVVTEDGSISDSMYLSVLNPVTALVVEQKEIITSASSIQAEFIIQPFDATNKNVTFSIDDESVAEVNHFGLITFKKPGEVNLTITTVDGGLQQTIKYIYTGGYAYDLILDKLTLNMNVDDAPLFIEYQTLPTNLYKTKVEFSSDDESIAYVDGSGYLNALKGGSTIIRLRVKKSETETIEKQIYVNIISPAISIELEDGMTAEKTFKLEPKSLPEDSTNLDYFYHVNEPSLATVSEDGLVTFLTDEPCTVTILVYANEDLSGVSKQVKVTYTAGKAGSFELVNKNLTLKFGDQVYLDYEVTPKNVSIKPLKLSLASHQPKELGGNVVEIMEDGSIKAVGGGQARVKAEFTLYDGTIIEQYCDITVLRDPTDIEINVDLENYEGKFVTSQNNVKFEGKVLPLDATERDIVWSVSDKNIAFINDNTLIFNKIGYVTLTATVGGISNSIDVYFTDQNPVFAELVAVVNEEKTAVPKSVMVGDSFEIEATAIVPSTITQPVVSIQATNQKTMSAEGKVFEIEGNKVKAVAGGSAVLIVRIANFLQVSCEITAIKMPEDIYVLQADTQVTTSTVNLVSTVLPYDTTNQKVIYVVKNTDVAEVQGSVLTFKKNGTAYVTAMCEADNNKKIDFTIEKIEKEVVAISCEEKRVSVNKGDVLEFKCDKAYSLQIKQSSPIIEGETVAEIEDQYLRTLAAGVVTVLVKTEQEEFEIEIEVKQLVENIVLKSNIDFYDDEYVVGSSIVSLDFEVLPIYAVDKQVSIKIISSVSAEGINERIAYIENGAITFIKAGKVTLEITSKDGNYSTTIKMRYTGGDALDANLNVDSKVVLNVGEQQTIKVDKWLPFDTENTFMSMYEVNASGKNIISINYKTFTITALESGETKLVVELSNGIVKEISVVVVNKVLDIVVEDDILTANEIYVINAVATPNTATNKVLDYVLQDTDIATIQGNTLHFLKAGKVKVTIKTTDGSNIEKEIFVTSTMGHISEIVLENSTLQISKNESARLTIKKVPFDCTEKLNFKILSQVAADGSDNNVISVTQDGQIEGHYGGTATVRIYACDADGEEVFADCVITVFSPLADFDVVFENEMDIYQNKNTFITSKSEIAFSLSVQPVDAIIKDFKCEVDHSNIARVEGYKIVFLQTGLVAIKFTVKDGPVEKSKTYSIFYAGDDLYNATLDKTGIDADKIYLEVGEEFEFKLSKALPSDNLNLSFSVKDVEEHRNDPRKRVATFYEGKLYAENGGSYSFELYVNNIDLGRYTLQVTRRATGLEIEGGEDVYVSNGYYEIKAFVLESDADQGVGFRSNTADIATVDDFGRITFSRLGKCQITVYVISNPEIQKVINIEWAKEIRAIEFDKNLPETLLNTQSVTIYVYGAPRDAEAFEYTLEIDRPDIAKLTKLPDGSGYLLQGIATKSGTVVVTAKVVGKEISATKSFTFYEKISDIKLELDASGDKAGQGQYRVFGNQFFENGQLTNTYTMKVSLNPEGSSLDLLEWSSNNESVATVDQHGKVTFVGAGRVTITVKQKSPYEGARVESDSYEFVVVEGINVANYEEFKIAHNKLKEINKERTKNLAAMVLHENIQVAKEIGAVEINYNLNGNGKIIDLSTLNERSWDRAYICRDNVILDNVILNATPYESGENLKNSGQTLRIANCQGILLYNSTFQNADCAMEIYCANVRIEGCIFQNCLAYGIKITRSATEVSDITVKDSIFASSCCGIFFHPDDSGNTKDNNLRLEGEIMFYNWATFEQIKNGFDLEGILNNHGLASLGVNLIYNAVKAILDSQPNFIYKYNNMDYYNIAIFQISAVFDLLGKHFDYQSKATIKLDSVNSSRYSELKGSRQISVAINIPIEYYLLTLSNNNPFTSPEDAIDISKNGIQSKVRAKIRRPCLY